MYHECLSRRCNYELGFVQGCVDEPTRPFAAVVGGSKARISNPNPSPKPNFKA